MTFKSDADCLTEFVRSGEGQRQVCHQLRCVLVPCETEEIIGYELEIMDDELQVFTWLYFSSSPPLYMLYHQFETCFSAFLQDVT